MKTVESLVEEFAATLPFEVALGAAFAEYRQEADRS